MNPGKNLTILILFLLIIMSLSEIQGESTANFPPDAGTKDSRVQHDIIWIDNNTDLKEQAESESWPGNGTIGNPYILSDYVINATNEYCGIYIGNVTDNFIIRNCKLFGTNWNGGMWNDKAGIYITASSNGIIDSCELEENRYGIFVTGSNNISIINTSSYCDHWAGFRLKNSGYLTVTNCTLNQTYTDMILLISSNNCNVNNCTIRTTRGKTYARGLYVSSSDNCLIENNYFSMRDGSGISVYGGSSIFVKNNSCTIENSAYRTYTGISISSNSGKCIVRDNSLWGLNIGIGVNDGISGLLVCNNNIWDVDFIGIGVDGADSICVRDNEISTVNNNYGIHVVGSKSCQFTGNNVSNCNRYGFLIYNSCKDISLLDNSIEDSGDYAIKIYSSSDSMIYRNKLKKNRKSTNIFNNNNVQAYDDGTNNKWAYLNEGNYWYDWQGPDNDNDSVVDSPYAIDGSAGASDPYPLVWGNITIPISIPSEPVNVSCISGRTFNHVSWDDPIDDGNSEIKGFRVYRNDSIGEPVFIAIRDANSKDYNDTDVIGAVEYTYWVSAFNEVGESDLSLSVNATPLPPYGDFWLDIKSPSSGILISERELTINWTYDLGDRILHSLKVRLDNGEWMEPDDYFHHTFQDLEEGSHTATVKVTIDNLEEIMDSVEFHVDFRRPTVNIGSPVNGSLIAVDHLVLVFTVSDLSTSIVSVDCCLDDNDPVSITGETEVELSNLEDGNHSIMIKAVDEAGNEGSSGIVFLVDTTPPVVLGYGPEGVQISPPDSIFIKFSERMNRSSMKINVSQEITFNITWIDDQILTLVPEDGFIQDRTYEVFINGTDLAGHSMTSLDFNFTIVIIPEISGTIKGNVTDLSGDPLAGVRITIGSLIYGTDENGSFLFQISKGTYSMIISLAGYQSIHVGINVISSNTKDIGTILLEPINNPDEPDPSDDDDEEPDPSDDDDGVEPSDDDDGSPDDDLPVEDDDDKENNDENIIMIIGVIFIVLIMTVAVIFFVNHRTDHSLDDLEE